MKLNELNKCIFTRSVIKKSKFIRVYSSTFNDTEFVASPYLIFYIRNFYEIK